MGEVIDGTITKVKNGDAQARVFLAAYHVGKPRTTHRSR
jgi:hypothetical protein